MASRPVLPLPTVVMETTVCSKMRTSMHSFSLPLHSLEAHDTACHDLGCHGDDPWSWVRAHAAPMDGSHPLHLTSQHSGPPLLSSSSSSPAAHREESLTNEGCFLFLSFLLLVHYFPFNFILLRYT